MLCNWAFDAAWGAGYYSDHKWTIGVAMFLAAAPSWKVGSVLRKRTAKTVIDKATGKEMVLDRANHRLFFVPMHHWGSILVVIGLVLCVMEFIQ